MPQKTGYSCLHTHTRFCDGKGEPEDYCKTAWEKGFSSLGFSAHAPITKKTGFPDPCWKDKEQRLDEYIEAVTVARKNWNGRLKVFLGLEVDYISGLMGPADEDYRKLGLDYIIGSVHFLLPPRGAPFCVDHRTEKFEAGLNEGYGGDISALTDAYYTSVESMLRLGGLDILGHPDLVKKNNANNRFFNEDAEFYLKKCKSTAELAGKCGIVIDVNTGGMNRGYLDSPYPSASLLKLFRENRVPAAINADAHTPEHLGGHYEEARRAMLAAGYTEMVLFNGRQNNRPVWEKIDISGASGTASN
ncbi:MAG: histidinol-phosphatase [Treponema sp.]|nr:histidinol-phosphatase [Treponema sp.]